MYIRNLKHAHLTSVFRQHNIHLVSSTCQHKYKWILCTEKPVLNASFQDFCFVSKKTITTYLKAKNSLHATRIYIFKYVFIVFFEKKRMLKYTFRVLISKFSLWYKYPINDSFHYVRTFNSKENFILIWILFINSTVTIYFIPDAILSVFDVYKSSI